eukprot:g5188.t1
MLTGQRSSGVRLRRRCAAMGVIAMVVPTDGHQLLSKRPNREEDFNGSFSVPDPTFASFFQYQLKRDAAKVDLSQNCLVWSTDTFVYTNDRKAKGGLDMGDEEEEGLNALLNQEPGYDDQTQHDWEVTAKIAAKNKEVSNNVEDAKCVDGGTELHQYQLISRDSMRDYYERISEAVKEEGGKPYRPMSTDGSQMVLKGYYVGGKVFGDLGYLARQKKEEEEEGQGSTETVEERVSAEEATRDVGVQTEGGENVESDGEEATPTDGEILEAYDESFVQRSSDDLFTRNLKNSTALVTSPTFLQKAEQSFAPIVTDPNSRFATTEQVVGEERREIDRNVVMKFFFGPNLGKVTQFTLPGSATASTRTIAAGINYVMGAFNSDAMGNPVPKRDGSVLLTVKESDAKVSAKAKAIPSRLVGVYYPRPRLNQGVVFMRESGYVMAEQRLRRGDPAFGTCTVDEEAKEFLDMVRTGDGIFSMNAWRKRFGSDGSNVFPPEVLDEQRIGAKNFTGTFTDRSAVEICQERVGERLPAFYYDDDEVKKNGRTNLRSLPPPDFVRLSPAYLVDDPGRSRAEDKFIGTRAHPTESLLWYGQRFEIYPIKSVALKSETRRFQVEEPVVEKEEPAEGRYPFNGDGVVDLCELRDADGEFGGTTMATATNKLGAKVVKIMKQHKEMEQEANLYGKDGEEALDLPLDEADVMTDKEIREVCMFFLQIPGVGDGGERTDMHCPVLKMAQFDAKLSALKNDLPREEQADAGAVPVAPSFIQRRAEDPVVRRGSIDVDQNRDHRAAVEVGEQGVAVGEPASKDLEGVEDEDKDFLDDSSWNATTTALVQVSEAQSHTAFLKALWGGKKKKPRSDDDESDDEEDEGGGGGGPAGGPNSGRDRVAEADRKRFADTFTTAWTMIEQFHGSQAERDGVSEEEVELVDDLGFPLSEAAIEKKRNPMVKKCTVGSGDNAVSFAVGSDWERLGATSETLQLMDGPFYSAAAGAWSGYAPVDENGEYEAPKQPDESVDSSKAPEVLTNARLAFEFANFVGWKIQGLRKHEQPFRQLEYHPFLMAKGVQDRGQGMYARAVVVREFRGEAMQEEEESWLVFEALPFREAALRCKWVRFAKVDKQKTDEYLAKKCVNQVRLRQKHESEEAKRYAKDDSRIRLDHERALFPTYQLIRAAGGAGMTGGYYQLNEIKKATVRTVTKPENVLKRAGKAVTGSGPSKNEDEEGRYASAPSGGVLTVDLEWSLLGSVEVTADGRTFQITGFESGKQECSADVTYAPASGEAAKYGNKEFSLNSPHPARLEFCLLVLALERDVAGRELAVGKCDRLDDRQMPFGTKLDPNGGADSQLKVHNPATHLKLLEFRPVPTDADADEMRKYAKKNDRGEQTSVGSKNVKKHLSDFSSCDFDERQNVLFHFTDASVADVNLHQRRKRDGYFDDKPKPGDKHNGAQFFLSDVIGLAPKQRGQELTAVNGNVAAVFTGVMREAARDADEMRDKLTLRFKKEAQQTAMENYQERLEMLEEEEEGARKKVGKPPANAEEMQLPHAKMAEVAFAEAERWSVWAKSYPAVNDLRVSRNLAPMLRSLPGTQISLTEVWTEGLEPDGVTPVERKTRLRATMIEDRSEAGPWDYISDVVRRGMEKANANKEYRSEIVPLLHRLSEESQKKAEKRWVVYMPVPRRLLELDPERAGPFCVIGESLKDLVDLVKPDDETGLLVKLAAKLGDFAAYLVNAPGKVWDGMYWGWRKLVKQPYYQLKNWFRKRMMQLKALGRVVKNGALAIVGGAFNVTKSVVGGLKSGLGKVGGLLGIDWLSELGLSEKYRKGLEAARRKGGQALKEYEAFLKKTQKKKSKMTNTFLKHYNQKGGSKQQMKQHRAALSGFVQLSPAGGNATAGMMQRSAPVRHHPPPLFGDDDDGPGQFDFSSGDEDGEIALAFASFLQQKHETRTRQMLRLDPNPEATLQAARTFLFEEHPEDDEDGEPTSKRGQLLCRDKIEMTQVEDAELVDEDGDFFQFPMGQEHVNAADRLVPKFRIRRLRGGTVYIAEYFTKVTLDLQVSPEKVNAGEESKKAMDEKDADRDPEARYVSNYYVSPQFETKLLAKLKVTQNEADSLPRLEVFALDPEGNLVMVWDQDVKEGRAPKRICSKNVVPGASGVVLEHASGGWQRDVCFLLLQAHATGAPTCRNWQLTPKNADAQTRYKFGAFQYKGMLFDAAGKSASGSGTKSLTDDVATTGQCVEYHSATGVSRIAGADGKTAKVLDRKVAARTISYGVEAGLHTVNSVKYVEALEQAALTKEPVDAAVLQELLNGNDLVQSLFEAPQTYGGMFIGSAVAGALLGPAGLPMQSAALVGGLLGSASAYLYAGQWRFPRMTLVKHTDQLVLDEEEGSDLFGVSSVKVRREDIRLMVYPSAVFRTFELFAPAASVGTDLVKRKKVTADNILEEAFAKGATRRTRAGKTGGLEDWLLGKITHGLLLYPRKIRGFEYEHDMPERGKRGRGGGSGADAATSSGGDDEFFDANEAFLQVSDSGEEAAAEDAEADAAMRCVVSGEGCGDPFQAAVAAASSRLDEHRRAGDYPRSPSFLQETTFPATTASEQLLGSNATASSSLLHVQNKGSLTPTWQESLSRLANNLPGISSIARSVGFGGGGQYNPDRDPTSAKPIARTMLPKYRMKSDWLYTFKWLWYGSEHYTVERVSKINFEGVEPAEEEAEEAAGSSSASGGGKGRGRAEDADDAKFNVFFDYEPFAALTVERVKIDEKPQSEDVEEAPPVAKAKAKAKGKAKAKAKPAPKKKKQQELEAHIVNLRLTKLDADTNAVLENGALCAGTGANEPIESKPLEISVKDQDPATAEETRELCLMLFAIAKKMQRFRPEWRLKLQRRFKQFKADVGAKMRKFYRRFSHIFNPLRDLASAAKGGFRRLRNYFTRPKLSTDEIRELKEGSRFAFATPEDARAGLRRERESKDALDLQKAKFGVEGVKEYIRDVSDATYSVGTAGTISRKRSASLEDESTAGVKSDRGLIAVLAMPNAYMPMTSYDVALFRQIGQFLLDGLSNNDLKEGGTALFPALSRIKDVVGFTVFQDTSASVPLLNLKMESEIPPGEDANSVQARAAAATSGQTKEAYFKERKRKEEEHMAELKTDRRWQWMEQYRFALGTIATSQESNLFVTNRNEDELPQVFQSIASDHLMGDDEEERNALLKKAELVFVTVASTLARCVGRSANPTEVAEGSAFMRILDKEAMVDTVLICRASTRIAARRILEKIIPSGVYKGLSVEQVMNLPGRFAVFVPDEENGGRKTAEVRRGLERVLMDRTEKAYQKGDNGAEDEEAGSVAEDADDENQIVPGLYNTATELILTVMPPAASIRFSEREIQEQTNNAKTLAPAAGASAGAKPPAKKGWFGR